nr:MAG TPA: hypothetical protein [Caudoviricetes sp.]
MCYNIIRNQTGFNTIDRKEKHYETDRLLHDSDCKN